VLLVLPVPWLGPVMAHVLAPKTDESSQVPSRAQELLADVVRNVVVRNVVVRLRASAPAMNGSIYRT
jgi:hypothetical protein